MEFNPLTLKFKGSDAHLEKNFLDDYLENSLTHMRLALILGCIFFAVFGALDAILISEKKRIIWAIRYGVICPTILLVIFLTYIHSVQQWLQPILCLLIVVSGGGIISMIIIAPPPISYSYYAGLILIFMFGYTIIRARFVWATLAGWIVVILYELAAVKYQTPVPVLINNNFFFVGSNLAGMIAGYAIEFYARRAYYLNLLLTDEKEKVSAVNLDLEKRVQERTAQLKKINDELSIEIHDRKKSQAELQVKNTVFESAITANSIADSAGVLTSINTTFLKTWGYKQQQDVIGKPIAHFFKFEKDTEKILEFLHNEGVWEGEFTALKNDGDTFVAYGFATTLHDNSKNITGYQSTVIDISDRIKIENEKIQAQKVAADQEKYALVGQIAGKMAHDFNNVLGIIMSQSELALLDCDDSEMKKTFELIFDQTLRGKNLTKNLNAFAKSSEPKQKQFSINDKIDFVLKLLRNDLENIDVEKEAPASIEIVADPGMIEHSLVNLIQNAIHALSLNDKPRIMIRIFEKNQTMFIEIEDNGCGIPEEHLENVYDPSFTLKGGQDVHGRFKAGIKGTGYGLSNVKKYIELHNGQTCIESRVGSGTKVTLSLPILKTALPSESEIEGPPSNVHSGKYILMVEDEPAISQAQFNMLTRSPMNHIVDIASNGQIAISMLEDNRYDLVSLDYMLPGRKNGMDVYLHIRETDKAIPILFISGNIEFLESIEKLKQDDPHLDHLSKPCTSKEYLTSINKLLDAL